MKLCIYCRSMMVSEYETSRFDVHRRKGFHTCPRCGALCDDDVTEKGPQIVIHSEKWFPPDEKTGDKK